MGKKLAERQIVVGDEPQRCFETLLDFETYPAWQRAVTACDVLSRDSDGRGRRVRQELDARVKSISYTVEYSYEPPHLMTWALVEGEVEDVDGEFVLEDLGDGTTLATCGLRLVAGSWLPGKAAHALNERVTRSSVEGLKARVESGA